MNNKFSRLRFLPCLIVALFACNGRTISPTQNNSLSNTVVIVEYTIDPAKRSQAFDGFSALIDEVKREPHFVSIRLQIDPGDESKILLYEEWSNADYYNSDHLKTPHLQKFMIDARAYLTGPPEISQWKIEKIFTPE